MVNPEWFSSEHEFYFKVDNPEKRRWYARKIMKGQVYLIDKWTQPERIVNREQLLAKKNTTADR